MHFWKSLECIPHFFMHLGLKPIVLINQNIGNIHNSTHSPQMFWLFVHCNPPFKLCQLSVTDGKGAQVTRETARDHKETPPNFLTYINKETGTR